MHTTTLREVGDSIMLVVLLDLLNQLQLKAGETVVVDVEAGRLIVEPEQRRQGRAIPSKSCSGPRTTRSRSRPRSGSGSMAL